MRMQITRIGQKQIVATVVRLFRGICKEIHIDGNWMHSGCNEYSRTDATRTRRHRFGQMFVELFVLHVEGMLQYAQFPEVATGVGVGQREADTVFGHCAFNVEGALVIDNVADIVPPELKKNHSYIIK